MPRHPRLFVPGVPVHIVQRGHDRQPVFVENEDFCFYLTNLVEVKIELSIRLLAYCLMTNHVHLVVVPGERDSRRFELDANRCGAADATGQQAGKS